MKVCIFRATDGACDYYRTIFPIKKAALNNALSYKELWVTNLLATIMYQKEEFIDAMDSDIYYLQHVSGDSLIKKIREFTKESKINAKILLDYDDDVFHVSPFSIEYGKFGTEDLKIVNNGQIIHEWKNGVNIDIKKNQERIDEIKRTCSTVDMITVTTEHLAKIYREFNDNVRVLPNCVDLEEWNKLDIRRKNQDEIRICWQGGYSHWEDLYLIKNSLKEIAAKNPNVKIVMVGYIPVSMEKDFRPEQLEFHQWVETPAHPYRMATLDIDIAVIPLKDTIFGRGKSPIKWIEFSALKIPSITSYVPPYDFIEEADALNKGLFVQNNDTQGWIKGLQSLIDDSKLREIIGANARNFVKENFDINTQYKQWVNVFEEVKSANSTQPVA
jgi:glycosyltransferase involved in cell wall biosynthesis